MSRDLFDDSTMTFGEHLEVLRVHLWKAIIGLVIGVALSLSFSNYVIKWIQKPVKDSMMRVFLAHEVVDINSSPQDLWQWVKAKFSSEAKPTEPAASDEKTPDSLPSTGDLSGMRFQIDVRELARKLKEVEQDVANTEKGNEKPLMLSVQLQQQDFDKLMERVNEQQFIPRTDGADEAFMLYLKVSFILGLVISSPWIFYQLWLFVAAGLYPHERKYVHIYLPMSVFLFLGGALFCFFVVIPFVLDFLFGFNKWLDLRPEMKIGTWISFAFMVSLMFGISFQLPLVMLFLERISLFSTNDYREKRRMSILAISVISMVLTPSDPVSMMLMMIPLLLLYEIGILLCGKGVPKSPFETQPA